MKRSQLIETLVKEGFTEKTLANFTDKQIEVLSSRIIGEQSMSGKGSVVMKKGSNPMDVKKITDSGVNVELREKLVGNQDKLDKNHNGKIDAQDFKILKGQKKKEVKEEEKPSAGLSKEKKSEVVKKAKKGEDIGKKGKGFEKIEKKAKESGAKDPKAVAAAAMWKNVKRENKQSQSVLEWVDSLVENNYHSFTSKNEIMELIKTKINEVEVGPNVKKGHNGVPEFMSYDAISNTDVKEAAPTTKPAPTKPKVEPGTKPKTPYQPGPGKDPKPKALKEKENADK